NQMYYIFALSMLLVYLVLAGQYESWFMPVSMLLAVPLSLVGPVVALKGLSGAGLDNNLYTQIGLVLLIALSAKNAILGGRGRAHPVPSDPDGLVRLYPGCAAAGIRNRGRRQFAQVDRHRGGQRDARLDLPGRAVRAVVLRRGSPVRGMARRAQG